MLSLTQGEPDGYQQPKIQDENRSKIPICNQSTATVFLEDSLIFLAQETHTAKDRSTRIIQTN